jgi:hypothetical protein
LEILLSSLHVISELTQLEIQPFDLSFFLSNHLVSMVKLVHKLLVLVASVCSKVLEHLDLRLKRADLKLKRGDLRVSRLKLLFETVNLS